MPTVADPFYRVPAPNGAVVYWRESKGFYYVWRAPKLDVPSYYEYGTAQDFEEELPNLDARRQILCDEKPAVLHVQYAWRVLYHDVQANKRKRKLPCWELRGLSSTRDSETVYGVFTGYRLLMRELRSLLTDYPIASDGAPYVRW